MYSECPWEASLHLFFSVGFWQVGVKLMMEEQLLPVDPVIPEEADPEDPQTPEKAPGEGILVPQGERELSDEGQLEAAGFQFDHSDLCEPGQRPQIFTEKAAASQVQRSGGRDPGVNIHPESLPISALDHADLQFPKGEFATGGNLMDFSNFLPGKQFDPFQQIVDGSETTSQSSDRLLSPISDRMEQESESAQTAHHPTALTMEPSRETESELDSQEISQDTIPDVYCQSCQIPIPAFEKLFGSHRHHRVAPLPLAAEAAKLECRNNVNKLEQQLIQMETFVNHLEEIFVTVEENIGKQEHYLEVQYDDLMQFLVQGYEDRSQELEEEKKLKLEKLYGELMSCGQRIDLYKELLETTQRLFNTEDKQTFLKNGQTTLAR
ncbi:hypothetical protein scyTo_0022433 [Scyliorhinus torazame]|uniref:Uncharacterized protein n=1 Tax=Scyliorhinus torazame TaxID=75743 RepID=A0A401Q6E1_SCYTO|nr:hypothetical protein [Scyliorhinus torazame]